MSFGAAQPPKHVTRRQVCAQQFAVTFGAVMLGAAAHAVVYRLNDSHAPALAAGASVALLVWVGYGILIQRRYTDRRPHPAGWLGVALLAASVLASVADQQVAGFLGLLLGALLVLIGAQLEKNQFLAEAKGVVAAQRCPTHGKTGTLEPMRNKIGVCFWIDGCCEQFVSVARAAVEELSPVQWMSDDEVSGSPAGRAHAAVGDNGTSS